VLDGYIIYIVGAGDDGKGFLRFDTASGAWSTLSATLNTKFGSPTFVLCGSLFAAGGEGFTYRVERYDVDTDKWTAVVDMLESRKSFCSVTIGSADPAWEQDPFDSLITKAVRERM
jgi:hypothetical protein